MDCKSALRLMEVCRPSGEDLVAPELTSLTVHLEECPECLGRLRTRQAFDARVANLLRSVAVPEGLRERIQNRLSRSVIQARRRKVVSYVAAAAAVLLVGVCFWAIAQLTDQRTVIEITRLSIPREAELEGVLDAQPPLQDPAEIENWCVGKLAALGLNATPPRNWPLDGRLIGIAHARVAGYRVAVFRYEDASSPGNRSAFVFAWSQEQFFVKGILSSPEPIPQNGGLTVSAWMEGRTNYVAVFKGGEPKDWQRLKKRPGLA